MVAGEADMVVMEVATDGIITDPGGDVGDRGALTLRCTEDGIDLPPAILTQAVLSTTLDCDITL